MKEEDFRCPECNGKVWKSVESGARQLGENPKKKYERYNCDKCKLFWARGDFAQEYKTNNG